MYGVLSNALLMRMLCWQERLAKAHGSQCGFCTPGMVMSMYTLLRNKPQPSMDDITQALAGVLDQFFLQSHFITSYFCCWINGTSKKQNWNLYVLLIPWLNWLQSSAEAYICTYLRRCVCVLQATCVAALDTDPLWMAAGPSARYKVHLCHRNTLRFPQFNDTV